MSSYNDLELKVLQWAEARQIIPNSKSSTQLMKAVTEIGELVDAELKSDISGIKDGVGDVLVCLIIYCDLVGVELTSCLSHAYDQIKDRKGKLMPNGVFVKEST